MDEPDNRSTALVPVVEDKPRRDTRWKKGAPSPNPGGRPSIPAEIKKQLMSAAPEALAQIVKLAQSAKSESVRLRACEVLLERVLGKVPQEITGAEGGPVQVAALVVLPSPRDED